MVGKSARTSTLKGGAVNKGTKEAVLASQEGQVFGVPLNPHDHGKAGVFDGLNHAGFVAGTDAQFLPETVNGLLVEAVHAGTVAPKDPFKSGSPRDVDPLPWIDTVNTPHLAVKAAQFAVKRPPEVDIDELRAPAYTEDGKPLFEGLTEATLLEFIAGLVNGAGTEGEKPAKDIDKGGHDPGNQPWEGPLAGGWGGLVHELQNLAAVEAGMNVRPAANDQAVEGGQWRIRRVAHWPQTDGPPTGTPNRQPGEYPGGETAPVRTRNTDSWPLPSPGHFQKCSKKFRRGLSIPGRALPMAC